LDVDFYQFGGYSELKYIIMNCQCCHPGWRQLFSNAIIFVNWSIV